MRVTAGGFIPKGLRSIRSSVVTPPWIDHGQCHKSLHNRLSPEGNWKLRIWQNEDLCSHFLGRELFQIKIFENIWDSCWENSGKYLFFFKYQFSQWIAAAIKFSFSRFFPQNTWFTFVESFNIIRPAVLVFWPKSPKKITFLTSKNICGKTLVFFHLYQKNHLFSLKNEQKLSVYF